MHGTLPDLPGPATLSSPPRPGRDAALSWLVRAGLAALGLVLGFAGGLALALGTGLMEFC